MRDIIEKYDEKPAWEREKKKYKLGWEKKNHHLCLSAAFDFSCKYTEGKIKCEW